jgi:hypothetical protein
MVSDTVPTVVNNYPNLVRNSCNVSGIVCKIAASKRPEMLSNELVPYLTFTLQTNLLIRQPMAERQINLKKGNFNIEKYPTTTTKMTGEGNESADHAHDKKEEQSTRVEETDLKMEDMEDNTPVEKVPNAKERKRKGGSKSDSSEPADDDSEKNNIDDDVPLSFPQRVSYCVSSRIG